MHEKPFFDNRASNRISK